VIGSDEMDSEGRASFSLEADNYTLRLQKGGFEPVELSVVIKAEKDTILNVRLERKPSIFEEFIEESKLFITKYWLILVVTSIVLVGIAVVVRRRH